jgi:hypothetical protein
MRDYATVEVGEARQPACNDHAGEASPAFVNRTVARGLKLPRFRGVVLDLGDYGSIVTASIAAS